MRTPRKASSGIGYFKKKISALHIEMFIRIMKECDIEPAGLGELLEDLGNQFLNLSDEIRLRILASHRSEAPAESCRGAGGHHR
jgi:hypothetical protein